MSSMVSGFSLNLFRHAKTLFAKAQPPVPALDISPPKLCSVGSDFTFNVREQAIQAQQAEVRESERSLAHQQVVLNKLNEKHKREEEELAIQTARVQQDNHAQLSKVEGELKALLNAPLLDMQASPSKSVKSKQSARSSLQPAQNLEEQLYLSRLKKNGLPARIFPVFKKTHQKIDNSLLNIVTNNLAVQREKERLQDQKKYLRELQINLNKQRSELRNMQVELIDQKIQNREDQAIAANAASHFNETIQRINFYRQNLHHQLNFLATNQNPSISSFTPSLEETPVAILKDQVAYAEAYMSGFVESSLAESVLEHTELDNLVTTPRAAIPQSNTSQTNRPVSDTVSFILGNFPTWQPPATQSESAVPSSHARPTSSRASSFISAREGGAAPAIPSKSPRRGSFSTYEANSSVFPASPSINPYTLSTTSLVTSSDDSDLSEQERIADTQFNNLEKDIHQLLGNLTDYTTSSDEHSDASWLDTTDTSLSSIGSDGILRTMKRQSSAPELNQFFASPQISTYPGQHTHRGRLFHQSSLPNLNTTAHNQVSSKPRISTATSADFNARGKPNDVLPLSVSYKGQFSRSSPLLEPSISEQEIGLDSSTEREHSIYLSLQGNDGKTSIERLGYI